MRNSTFAMMLGGDDEDDGPGLTHEQQITRLTEYYAQIYGTEPERFEPGQIIWHKNPELADTRSAGSPILFVRYLEELVAGLDLPISDPGELSSSAATSIYDCVAMIVRDGVAFEYLMDSRRFTATPPRSST